MFKYKDDFATIVIVCIVCIFSFASFCLFFWPNGEIVTVNKACGTCEQEQQGKVCGEWTCTKRGWK